MERTYGKLAVSEKAEKSLRGGHPWVYGDEVTDIERPCANGELTDVYSGKGRWLGTGFYNDRSKLRVRILSDNPNDRFDEAFWTRRLRYALVYRQTVMGTDFSDPAAGCRLVFGESDQLPGLTVDRFGDVLSAECLCYGMEVRKEFLYRTLVRLLREEFGVSVRALYERNDSPIRGLEGLPAGRGFYPLEGLATDLSGKTEIVENGIVYEVDYANGQKTGFFLDQKDNRKAAARLAKGKRVLDCFTHTGAFALNAAMAGAEHVTAVDISADALTLAKANAVRNGLSDRMDFVQADVFEFLTTLLQSGGTPYDFIILDPPAFTKSSRTVRSAYNGYREINCKAMRLLPRGGYLATCSCSHFMKEPLFREMLDDASAGASVRLRQIEARQQAADHPILWKVPETYYLKFSLFQVV